MFRHTPLRLGTLAALFAGLLIAALTAGYFGLEIVTEIAILAILVLALDIVAGFGGMVSLCHGALMGVGAYAYAVLATQAGAVASRGDGRGHRGGGRLGLGDRGDLRAQPWHLFHHGDAGLWADGLFLCLRSAASGR